jgi:hypothetical protein
MFEFPRLPTCKYARIVQGAVTYPGAVWRMPTLFVVVPHFMEVIFVQLSDKARKVAVFEVFG